MARFVKILSILFVVSASYASESSASANNTQPPVQEAIETILNNIEDLEFKILKAQNDTDNKNQEVLEELSNAWLMTSFEMIDDFLAVVQQVKAEIEQLVSNATGVDIDQCLQYPDRFHETAAVLNWKTSNCFSEKHKAGIDQILSMNTLFENTFAELNATKEEINNCHDDIRDESMSDGIMSCINEAKQKAHSNYESFSKEWEAKNNVLDAFPGDFDQLLATCKTEYKFPEFLEKSSTIVRKTNECIQQRINGDSITVT